MTEARSPESILHEARALTGDARARFVSQACASDAALRGQVEALLSADAEAGSFLASAQQADPDATIPKSNAAAPLPRGTERAGQIIGRFKLLQQIGEGGFGSVWMAEQREPVVRRVALKIIKLGMDTRQVIARFEAERQALALMDHPNIAKVLDAGATDTGRPYFVMELCTGDSITEYCDRNNLSIPERLELVAQVCQAVQHAHQKGLIHRDIKPSNILVSTQDGRPHAKVIDFGIAKATASRLTEKTLFTEHKQLIGTPQYMSPEQAEGSLDIDTRTDVYSLGVLLYELLTGTTPFDAKSLRSAAYAEIQRIIRQVEPPKPSTRLSQNTDTLANVAARRHIEPKKLGTIIRGELDWIVMKCLEKDRQRRYEAANGLAMDIRRYLTGEAVVAAPPSAVYRFRKFVRRNKGTVTAGAAVAAALLIGMIAFASQAKVADQQRVIAQANEQKAIAEAKRAATAKGEETKARKQAETISDFVIKALQAGDAQSSGAELGTDGAGPDMTILAAMDDAARDIDSGRFRDDPQTESQLRITIGIILRNNGKYDKARPLLEQALAMYERLLNRDDPMVAHALIELGMVHTAQGQNSQAELLFKRALEIREQAFGPDHPQVAFSLNFLASLYQDQGHYEQAEPLFTRALSINEKALDANDSDLASSLNNLALLYVIQGQYAQAEPLFSRALAINERALGPNHPRVALTLNSLAELYRAQGRLSEAVPLCERALAIWEKTLGPDHPTVASGLNNLANLQVAEGKYVPAELHFKRALAVHEQTLGPDHFEVATDLGNLALLYHRQGKFDLAESAYNRALAIRETALGPDHPRSLNTKANLAGLYWSQRKLDKSVPLFEEVFKAQEAKLGRQHPSTLFTAANVGVNYRDAGRLAQAIPLLEEAHRASNKHPELRKFGPELLDAYIRAADPANPGDTARVVALTRELLATARGALPEDSPELAGQLATLGLTLLGLRAWDEAEPLIREALAIRETNAPDDWRTFNTKSMLGGALLGQNKRAEAERLLLEGYRGMKEREATIPPQGATRIPEALERLVRFYEATGNEPKSAAWRSLLEAARAAQAKPDPDGAK